MEQKLVWHDDYVIRAYEMDYQSKLRPNALLNLLNESAGRHADHLSYGWESMHNQGWFWALARIELHINQYPNWKENLHIQTWPKHVDRLFAYRDFRLFNAAGTEIGVASTAWLIVDASLRKTIRPDTVVDLKHRIKNAEQQPSQEFLSEIPQEAILVPPEKIAIPAQYNYSVPYTIKYTDLDINGHVNNVAYFNWVYENIPFEVLKNKYLTRISLNFISEMTETDEVELKFDTSGENTWTVHGIKNKSQTGFLVKLMWQDK